jgi:hypothetical protein
MIPVLIETFVVSKASNHERLSLRKGRLHVELLATAIISWTSTDTTRKRLSAARPRNRIDGGIGHAEIKAFV